MRTPEDCIAALRRLPRTGLHVQREQAFRSYFLCLSQFTFESPVAVSPSHIEYFSLVASNESEHKYIRGIASFLSGYVKCVLSQRGEGDIARAVALFDDLSQSERGDSAWRFESRESETVEDCLGGPYGWRTLASEIVEHGFDGPEGSNSDNDSEEDDNPAFLRNMRIQAAALIKVNPDRPLAEEKVQHLYRMCQRVVAFKSVCIVCKTTSSDAQRKLEYCAACKTVKYHSKECQRVHWKAGHKRCCRPAQDLRKGDIVQLQGLVARSDLNGSYRELGEFNQEKGRWEVTWLRGSNGILIKPDNLVRAVTVEEMVDFYAITGGIPSFF